MPQHKRRLTTRQNPKRGDRPLVGTGPRNRQERRLQRKAEGRRRRKPNGTEGR